MDIGSVIDPDTKRSSNQRTTSKSTMTNINKTTHHFMIMRGDLREDHSTIQIGKTKEDNADTMMHDNWMIINKKITHIWLKSITKSRRTIEDFKKQNPFNITPEARKRWRAQPSTNN